MEGIEEEGENAEWFKNLDVKIGVTPEGKCGEFSETSL